MASTHLGFRLDGLATASPYRLLSESAVYVSGVQIPPFYLCPVQQSQAVGFIELAEREGFEPSIPFGIRAFQARAIDHYAISPNARKFTQLEQINQNNIIAFD